MALAYAYWIDGAFQKALRALDESRRLHEDLGEYEKFCEILAMQAQVHLALGDVVRALDCSREAVLALAQGARATDMKAEVFFARSAALAAAGRDEEALNFVRGAYESLLSIAAKLADDQARRAFFRRDPITRRLMEAVYARGIAEPLEAGQLTRWLPSQRNDYAVQVRWTVDAGPADVALKQHKGAIILRRQRLARLIQEAETQGIDPRNKDLAAALGVSVRTIQRDRTHLQQAAMRAPGGVL
jgi:tetratricopeptide (TPR) repeat protein